MAPHHRGAGKEKPARAKSKPGGHPKTPKVNAGAQPWALERVEGNLTFSGSGAKRIIAWYLLEPQMWSFRSVAEGEQLIRRQAEQIAKLDGSTVYGRITSKPYPIKTWAKAAWANSPAPTEGFSRVLVRDQAMLRGRMQADKLVFFGVDLGARSTMLAAAGGLLSAATQREVTALSVRLGEIDSIMSSVGLEAIRATGNDMAWLLARSFALGCPLPEQTTDPTYEWSKEDLAEFAGAVSWDADPLAQSVRVVSSMDTTPATQHVVVLTVGRMAELAIPERDQPWIAKTDNLPFPVEWSFRVDVRTPAETMKEMTKLGDRITSQIDHYEVDHQMRPPKQLRRQAKRAHDVEDETRSGFDGLSTRTKGRFRIAVSGASEEEALKRAAEVQKLYAPAIKIERELDQYRLAREFVPCEPLANAGHTRHLPVLKLAAGVPAATAEVGDKRGILLGRTAGFAEAPVMFDPWYLPENSRSGLIPLTGTLGSGKTVLAAGIVYKTCQQGVPWNILDPSGMLTAMATMPEFAGVAHAANLLNSEPGALNPYAQVAVPQPSWFEGEDDPQMKYLLAVSASQAERRDLVEDTLRWCVPQETLDRPGVRDVLRDAIWAAPAEPDSMVGTVLDNLREMARGEGAVSEQAALLLRRLEEARERELARLFYATPHTGDRGEASESRRLTIYSLKGLTQPDKSKALADWTITERLSRPIMSLAAHTTLRAVYRLDRHERKGAFLDEVHEITEVPTGGTLVQKGSTDSRKHNWAFMISTQNASRILGQGVENFVGAAFVGRTNGEDQQAAAARLMGLPTGVGYEHTFGELSPTSRRNPDSRQPREFIFRDGQGGAGSRGGMEKIRVDFSAHPEFMAVIDSTPDATKRRASRDTVSALEEVPTV